MNILIQINNFLVFCSYKTRYYLFAASLLPSAIISRAAMATYKFFLPEELRVERERRYITAAEEVDWDLIQYHAWLGEPEVEVFYQHARNHFNPSYCQTSPSHLGD